MTAERVTAAAATAAGGAPRTPPRERLLHTAARLFYAEGIHGVGVDRIVTEAGVTRATMYRHFAGKDALVLAYLREVDAGLRERVRALAETAAPRRPAPADVLEALVGGLEEQICGPGFRGCAFINAAAEHPDATDPVHRVVVDHRAWFAATAGFALARAGHPDPSGAAQRLLVLRDGAMVAGYLGDATGAGRALRAGLEALLAEARASSG